MPSQQRYMKFVEACSTHAMFLKRVDQRLRVDAVRQRLRDSPKRRAKSDLVKHGTFCQPGSYKSTTLRCSFNLTKWGQDHQDLGIRKRYVIILGDAKARDANVLVIASLCHGPTGRIFI